MEDGSNLDLPAALRHAKRAIQDAKNNPAGYTRAGEVLIRMKKPNVALEVYTHGLKHVKHVGKGYEQLREAHEDLMNEISPRTSVDPLTKLPRELAELILEFLGFRQRINACRVSKQWAHFIRSSPNLWQHLDLSGAKRKVRSAFISRAINTARQRLTAATLTMLMDFDKTLAALLRHCPIQELTLLDTGLQSRNLVDAFSRAKHLKALRLGKGTVMGPTSVAQIIKTCATTLEDLGLSEEFVISEPCDRLKKLVLTSSASGRSARGGALGTNTPFLSLEKFAPNLQCLDATVTIGRELRLPSSLTILRLKSTVVPSSTTFYLPHLRELSVDIPNLTVRTVEHILAIEDKAKEMHDPETSIVEPIKLQALAIRSCAITGDEMDDLLGHPRLGEVSQLTLYATGLRDEHINLVTKRLPELQTVDLSGTEITGVSVRELVMTTKVKHLVLGNCRYLGRDAVDWARSQGSGLRVDYWMSQVDGGSKKVRY